MPVTYSVVQQHVCCECGVMTHDTALFTLMSDTGHVQKCVNSQDKGSDLRKKKKNQNWVTVDRSENVAITATECSVTKSTYTTPSASNWYSQYFSGGRISLKVPFQWCKSKK